MLADSGISVGDFVPSFEPMHVAGPDKGTETCPPCKYGLRPAVQVWVNGDDQANVVKMVKYLDGRVKASKADFKAFVIVLDNGKGKSEAEALAKAAGTENVGIAFVKYGEHNSGEYGIDTSAKTKNTVFVYKNIRVMDKFTNLKADTAGMKSLASAVDKIDKVDKS